MNERIWLEEKLDFFEPSIRPATVCWSHTFAYHSLCVGLRDHQTTVFGIQVFFRRIASKTTARNTDSQAPKQRTFSKPPKEFSRRTGYTVLRVKWLIDYRKQSRRTKNWTTSWYKLLLETRQKRLIPPERKVGKNGEYHSTQKRDWSPEIRCRSLSTWRINGKDTTIAVVALIIAILIAVHNNLYKFMKPMIQVKRNVLFTTNRYHETAE